MAGKTAVGEAPLEFTPTWVVALLCFIIILISVALERFLHFLGEKLKEKKQNALYEALLKVKEELMLLGFISLLLTVLQDTIHRVCVPPHYMNHMWPCKEEVDNITATAHSSSTVLEGAMGGRRRLLAGKDNVSNVCVTKGEVPLLSLTAIHKLHIFIFVLAITHVLFTVVTMLLGLLRIRKWKAWERSIQNDMTKNGNTEDRSSTSPTDIRH